MTLIRYRILCVSGRVLFVVVFAYKDDAATISELLDRTVPRNDRIDTIVLEEICDGAAVFEIVPPRSAYGGVTW